MDGPAASGKSTTAKKIAAALNFEYLDTGAMYRASAFLVSSSGIDVQDGSAASDLLFDHSIDVSSRGVFLDGNNISGKIRTQAIGEAASIISAHRAVRDYMVSLQRAFGEKHNTVAEGRDMGTVVFPNAALKVYVVADIAVRAWRRLKDMNHDTSQMNSMVQSVFRRDYRDRNRSESPLRLPPGALWLDGTTMSIDQQVNFVLRAYAERCII
ncbi:MAG: (d)CMP kinase [Candidatus Sabulitectum sp.]|nr:(d)CMP kinase [Candidatus Sabulitectum sp.]